MQKYEMTRYRLPTETGQEFDHVGEAIVYLASEVDARDAERLAEIAKLKAALHRFTDVCERGAPVDFCRLIAEANQHALTVL